jgi:uncharacterized membrane protein YkoI
VKQSAYKWLACAAVLLDVTGCSLWQGQEALPAREIAGYQASGTILPFNRLNAYVIARHPGSEVQHAALDKIGDRFLYQASLNDPNKMVWFVEIDAKTGETVTDQQDPK